MKFIEVILFNGMKCIVNSNNILYVQPVQDEDDCNSIISTCNNDLYVKETYEEIKSLLLQ